MISPGSLCNSPANRNYLKLFVSRNCVFEVYNDEHEPRFKCARLQTSSMWTKIL
jgi:hypothetical protein